RSSTWSGSLYRPANISRYARATRAGVSFRPSRSGSSPQASNSSRTAFSARAWSNTRPVACGASTLSSSTTTCPLPETSLAIVTVLLVGSALVLRAWLLLRLRVRIRLCPRPRGPGVGRRRRSPPGRRAVVRRPCRTRTLLAVRLLRPLLTAAVLATTVLPTVAVGAVRPGRRCVRVVRLRVGLLFGSPALRRSTLRRSTLGLPTLRLRGTLRHAALGQLPALRLLARHRTGRRRRGHRFGLATLVLGRPRLAALGGQLTRRLDRRLVRGQAFAELVEHRDPRPLLHRGEDALEVAPLQGLLLEHLGHEVVEHVAVGVQHLPRLGVRGLDQLADFLVDLVCNLEGVVRLLAGGTADERVALLLAVLDGAE